MTGFRRWVLAAAVAGCAFAGRSAQADTIVTFSESPGSSAIPEFVYSATTGLDEGPGAVGDFGLGLGSGLVTIVPAIFPDATLTLGGLGISGTATEAPPGQFTQGLAPGSFDLFSGPGPSGGILLLSGTITGATVVRDASVGSVLSGDVVYTGGAIFAALPGAGLSNSGTLSFSLTGLTGSAGVNGSGVLTSFSANGTGLFTATAVPLPPAVWGGLGLLGICGIAAWNRRRQLA